MHILFPFSLTKHLYLLGFLFLLSDICVSLVFMWSQSGKMESSTGSFGKSGPCLNPVAVVVTVEDFSGGQLFPAFSPGPTNGPSSVCYDVEQGR